MAEIKKCVERDCGKEFEMDEVFNKRKKQELASQGIEFVPPKRCRDCGTRKKRENDSAFGGVARQQRREQSGDKGDNF